MRKSFLLAISFTSLSFFITGCSQSQSQNIAKQKLCAGGTNLVYWDIKDEYIVHNEPESWYKPGVISTTVGSFHLHEPGYCETLLKEMYQNGQRNITLMIWHAPLENQDVYGHLVTSKGGQLLPQHQQNLRDTINLLKKTGFKYLTVRFATQGASDPGSWQNWNEQIYQENFSFILTTRQLVNQTAASNFYILYDLGAELGGIDAGQTSQYTKRVWKDYTDKFGKSDTIGFTYATYPGRLKNMLEIYNQVGVTPDIHAFDIYGDEEQVMKYISEEFSQAGIQNPDIIITETFYNDCPTNHALRSEAARKNLNLLYITQWPIEKGKLYWTEEKTQMRHFSVKQPVEFNCYLSPLP